MAIKRGRSASMTGYEKISATIERPVLRMIRERSTNVSEFLNEAAKDKLYFERLSAAVRELERSGVAGDPARRQRLRAAFASRRRARTAAKRSR